MLESANLCFVDTGARGGPPRQLGKLARFARLIAFEPDEGEAGRLQEQLWKDGRWRDVTVVAEALGFDRGVSTLHVTALPGMSSFRPPDPRVVGRYCRGEGFDVRGTQSVRTVPLDEASASYSFEDACFLKLDTQGTELEILRSGERLIEKSVVGVFTEVEFQPFYTGQALFGDVDKYLRTRAFLLVDLRLSFLRGRDFRQDLYSRHQPVWAHCLYLRDRELLEEGKTGELGLARYVALSVAYQHHDLALAAVTSGRSAAVLESQYGPGLARDLEDVILASTTKRLRGLTEEKIRARLDAALER